MDPLEAIRCAQATRLVDEDGDEVEFELAPGLPPADIERLADELGVPLSRELRALLERTAGIDDGPLESIDFTGQSLSFEAPEAFPSGLPIAGDGFGNFWILDLHEAFRMLVPPHASAVDDVHEDRLFNVWRDNPGTTERSAALASDERLSAFAEELGRPFHIRRPTVVTGWHGFLLGPLRAANGCPTTRTRAAVRVCRAREEAGAPPPPVRLNEHGSFDF
jgi:hypothetical protein